MNLSRAQEREERTKLGRGLLLSIFAILFCWIPLLGFLLSASGFLKVFTRVTYTHRHRRRTYLTVTLIILILCTGVQMAGLYAYVENPNILADTGMWVYTKLTGQTQLPGSQADDYNYMGGVDYGEDSPGMGYDPSLYESGDEGDMGDIDSESDFYDSQGEGDEFFDLNDAEPGDEGDRI